MDSGRGRCFVQRKSHWKTGLLECPVRGLAWILARGRPVVLGELLLGQPPETPLAQVVCGVGRGDRPLRHQSSLPLTLEVALAQCGLGEAAQVAVVRRRVKAAAEAALAAVLALETGLSAEQRGGRRARTDFLGECVRPGLGAGAGGGGEARGRPALTPRPPPGPGVDFALTVAGGALTPVALELNGCLCLEACGALEGLWAAPRRGPAAEAAASAPLVETMLRRSARCLMEGRQLLLIGAGGVSKKFVWEAARDYGLKVGGARERGRSGGGGAGAGRGRSPGRRGAVGFGAGPAPLGAGSARGCPAGAWSPGVEAGPPRGPGSATQLLAPSRILSPPGLRGPSGRAHSPPGREKPRVVGLEGRGRHSALVPEPGP